MTFGPPGSTRPPIVAMAPLARSSSEPPDRLAAGAWVKWAGAFTSNPPPASTSAPSLTKSTFVFVPADVICQRPWFWTRGAVVIAPMRAMECVPAALSRNRARLRSRPPSAICNVPSDHTAPPARMTSRPMVLATAVRNVAAPDTSVAPGPDILPDSQRSGPLMRRLSGPVRTPPVKVRDWTVMREPVSTVTVPEATTTSSEVPGTALQLQAAGVAQLAVPPSQVHVAAKTGTEGAVRRRAPTSVRA